MRSAGNFHPEWGYLAPAPGFMRTLRVALVATAIGATAGAVVVVSLVERPGADDANTSIAAHALVTSAPIVTAPVVASPVVAVSPAGKALSTSPSPAPVRPTVQPAAAIVAPVKTPNRIVSNGTNAPAVAASARTVNVASSAAVPPTQARVAPVAVTQPVSNAVTPPAANDDVAPIRSEQAAVPDENPAKKVLTKKRRAEAYSRRAQSIAEAKRRWANDGGFGPLLRLFSFRTGSSPYPN